MPAQPRLTGHTHLTVRPWLDVTIDAVGHDPRSYYAERFWLPILGPSVLWLLRRTAHTFDAEPDGAEIDLEETARDLGLSYRGGSTSAFGRALVRCIQFRMGRILDERTVELRRNLPHLTRRQLDRLTDAARSEHDALMDARRSGPEERLGEYPPPRTTLAPAGAVRRIPPPPFMLPPPPV